ncbi:MULTISPECIES: alpha/beta hydrolase [unclassified Streptomyces]|uniref:alpha/beta fold hydrolase n=1 Tax=unclassified Streptomyces TaxID=2593676 RepID=UPI0006FA57AC|nr:MULTISPECIES: alpha/beta hydrolase [unclassified Streptomyces]KQX49365.1 alpha/beta hydrolase [Streptomyces sp. Root1304]KRA78983.1 alpha/beta hydrolase [Streptomyces sp. Root66D1]
MNHGTLPVPGATLRYETRGSGPVLLLIPGGAGDAGLFEGMADLLASAGHTVVSYDPRGLSRSPLDGPAADQSVEEWSEDAARLLDLLAPDREAYVFGSSSGAIVALDLLARHPERLRRVVAHEPPLLGLLAEPAPHRALFAEVRELARTAGVGPATARFTEGLGGGRSDGSGSEEERNGEPKPTELPPGIQEMAGRMTANMPFFLEHMLCPFSSSTPEVEGLRAAAGKLVLGVGATSAGQEPLVGPAARLAELTGVGTTEFPGGHLGCTERPAEFAEVLLTALRR